MSDSEGPKTKATPSWQRQEPSSTPKQTDDTPPQNPAEQDSPEPRAPLIDSASKFLEDDAIRDAPIERKKLFLESKGLTEAQVDDLLEFRQPPKAATEDDNGLEPHEASQPAPPTTSTPPLSQNQTPSTPPKDNPPIITYPEFLLHAQKPGPLLTADRLLTSLYIASGAAATIYGTSKYLLEPMLSSLTSARHSLFDRAGANIDTLNKKLESAVSKVPDMPPRFKNDDDDDSDTESITSDGARFFNRSAGTQTSPRLSRSISSASAEADEAISPAQDHASALLGIHSKLSGLLPPDGEPNNPLGDSISQLRSYLEKLPYTSTIHPGSKAGRKRETDAVANVKAEIRGVKGVLLSARNFPSGVTAR